MLGDLISEEKGKITTQRVLEVEGGEPKMETSFSATGNYRGVETTATVSVVVLSDLVERYMAKVKEY